MEKIFIEDRKIVEISGALKVVSSTNSQAVIEVEGSNLVIYGSNIEVTKLNLESKEVTFSGEIAGIKYMSKTEKVGLLKRIFK